MKKVLAGILILVLCFGLVACGGNEPQPTPEPTPQATEAPTVNEVNPLVGTWQADDGFYVVFNEDGSGVMNEGGFIDEFTWNAEDEVLVIIFEDGERISQPYLVSSSTLTVDGETMLRVE